MNTSKNTKYAQAFPIQNRPPLYSFIRKRCNTIENIETQDAFVKMFAASYNKINTEQSKSCDILS